MCEHCGCIEQAEEVVLTEGLRRQLEVRRAEIDRRPETPRDGIESGREERELQKMEA